jgi:hypothetical protein
LARSDAKYAIADRLDEAKGEYVGLKLAQLVTIDLNSDMVLVRRDLTDAQLAKQAQQMAPVGDNNTGKTATQQRPLPASSRPEESPPRARGPAASMPRLRSTPIVRRRRSATSPSRS